MEIETLFKYIEYEMNIGREDLNLSLVYWKKYNFKKGEYSNEYGNIYNYLGFVM